MFLNKFGCLTLTLCNLYSIIMAYQDAQTLVDAMINSSINSTKLPCENFYSYACGNYKGQYATDASYNDIITYLDHQYNLAILNLFEAKNEQKLLSAAKDSQTFVEKTKLYLRSCLREEKRNLTKYLEVVKPGPQANWPLLQHLANNGNQNYPPGLSSDAADFDVWSLLGKLQSYGLNDVLIYQEILIDREGAVSIMMSPFLMNEQNTLPDVKVLHILLLQMGIKKPALIIHQLKKTHKTLINILNGMINIKETSLQMSFGDLEIFYPNLNLSSFLSELLGKQLPADTFVLLRSPSYFKYLNDNFSTIFDKEHIINYLMAKFLYLLAFDGTAQFKHTACIKDLRSKFDLAVNFLYHYHIFAKQSTAVMQDISEIFKLETDMMVKYFISNYLQLTDLQKELLLTKLAHIRLNVGNLPANVDFEKVEEYYAQLPSLDEYNYYKNHLIMLKLRFAKSIVYAQNQTYFMGTDNKLASTSAAFYVPSQNMIVLPFASLMQPLYDLNYHNLTKFSLLGFVLVHELAHAFDTNGLNFDHIGLPSHSLAGVLKNINFQNTLKCLQNHLATNSIDELIADNVALQIVQKILTSKFKNTQTKEAQTNWRKIFFLQLAQIFCNQNNIKFIDHDSDSDRLNVMVMNMKGFSQAFQCCGESKMNPRDKCRLY